METIAKARWLLGICGVLVVALAVGSGALASPGERIGSELPIAGDDGSWPIEITYELLGESAEYAAFSFRGNSWEDWQWEALTGDIKGECEVRTPTHWLAGFNGCEGDLPIIEKARADEAGFGPADFLFPGAAMKYMDAQPVSGSQAEAHLASALARGNDTRGRKVGGMAAATRPADELSVFVSIAAGNCMSRSLRFCSPEVGGALVRAIVHEPTGLILSLERRDRSSTQEDVIEDMIVRTLSTGRD